MKKLRGELKKDETKIEIKVKKKIITDLYKLQDIGKDRSYMKHKTEAAMQKENYFPKAIKKKRLSKKNSLKYQGESAIPSLTAARPSISSDENRGSVEQFEIEAPKTSSKKGCFDNCIDWFKNLFGKKNEGEDTEHLNP